MKPWYVQLPYMVLGTGLLIPFSLAKAWEPCQSTVGGPPALGFPRMIDRWKWKWLQSIYGNPEDGVSGQWAYVWKGNNLTPYMPRVWAPLRAYCWSAWRNSTNMMCR